MVFKNSLNHFAVYFFSQVVQIPLFLPLEQHLEQELKKVKMKGE